MLSSLRAKLDTRVDPVGDHARFPNSGEGGPLDLGRVSTKGISRVLRGSRNASGRGHNYFDVTNRWAVVRCGD